MKFIADFTEIEQYEAMAKAVDSIKELLSLKEIEEIRAKLPQGTFDDEEKEAEARGEQGYKNLLEIISILMKDHAELLITVNHAFWKPETIKRPAKEQKWDEDGFLVEDYKRDDEGHIVYEDYTETENDYPSIIKTVGTFFKSNSGWIADFFTLLKNAKSLI